MKHLQLFEIYFKDIYGIEFDNFRKKYTKYKSDKNYYIQFTDFKSDILDKSINLTPNHSDPAGNYAYPLSYVINNPADIWYGSNSKYLRVLKKTPNCKTLKLNYINEHQCIDYLCKTFNMRYYDVQYMIEEYLIEYKDIFKSKKNYWGKLFFSIMQNSYDNGIFTLLNNEEQTKRFIKLGFDAIEELSKSDKSAIINNREPEQIIFLNRKGFDIEEVITLSGKNNLNTSMEIPPNVIRKLGSDILSIFGEKIKDDKKSFFNNIFYGTKGTYLDIKLFKPQSYYDNNIIGIKKHKDVKLSTYDEIVINIKTTRGDFKTNEYNNETTFDFIIDDIKNQWDEIKDNDIIYEPYKKEDSVRMKK